MTLPSALQEIVDELNALDQAARSEFLIEFAEEFQPVPESVVPKPYPEKHRVPGCESEVFLWVKLPEGGDGPPQVEAAVLNPQGISAMAMVSILKAGLADATPEEVEAIPNELVYQFFGRGLSMGKGQGLMSMIGMTKALLKEELQKHSPG